VVAYSPRLLSCKEDKVDSLLKWLMTNDLALYAHLNSCSDPNKALKEYQAFGWIGTVGGLVLKCAATVDSALSDSEEKVGLQSFGV